MMKRPDKTKALIAWVLLISAAIGWFLLRSQDYSRLSNKIDAVINEQLKRFDITDRNLLKETALEKSRLKTKWLLLDKEYYVPGDFSFKQFQGSIEKAIKPKGFKIAKTERGFQDQKEILVLAINFKNLDVYCLKLIKRAIGIKRPFLTRPVIPAKVAIVIDDWGYNLNNLELLSTVDEPLTLAILPNLAYSTQIARLAQNDKNRQAIIHLPLEPHDSTLRLEENTIMANMDKKQVLDILSRTLTSVPHARGFSNHRGSRLTEDQTMMKIILTEAKRRNMFFLDSLATNKSVAEAISKQTGVKFAKRSIFLDNMNEPDYIKRQLLKLANVAQRTGSAIGIGHDKQVTLKVLKEMLPALEANGIEIVFVSQLVTD